MSMDVDTRGRVRIEPTWPAGGMVSKPLSDRHYDVQQYTGFSSSTVSQGQWERGRIVRFRMPNVRPPFPTFMYDPTNPNIVWRANS